MTDRNSFIMRRVTNGIRGLSEALYPVNDFGAPDWQDVDMVKRTYQNLFLMPPFQRFLLLVLYCVSEIVLPLLVPAIKPFSKVSLENRIKTLQRMKKSKIFFIRLFSEAIKAALQMIYMSHPTVLEYIGEYKHCPMPKDPFAMPIKSKKARKK